MVKEAFITMETAISNLRTQALVELGPPRAEGCLSVPDCHHILVPAVVTRTLSSFSTSFCVPKEKSYSFLGRSLTNHRGSSCFSDSKIAGQLAQLLFEESYPFPKSW